MKDHDRDYRGFIWGSQSYYWQHTKIKDVDDEITFGLFSPEGGTSGEMTVTWKQLNGSSVPFLRAFDDSWSALSTFSDVIAEMGKIDDKSVTPQEFANLLLSCGFQDDTRRINPYSESELVVRTMNVSEQDIKDLHSLFLECGRTFMMCRIGEDTDDGRKMRLELEEPYNKLAKKWDRIVESLDLNFVSEGENEYTDAEWADIVRFEEGH